MSQNILFFKVIAFTILRDDAQFPIIPTLMDGIAKNRALEFKSLRNKTRLKQKMHLQNGFTLIKRAVV